MHYQVLGPLTAAVDGDSVNLGGPKQRLVLALLLMEAGRTVSADRLIDRIWDEEPPPGSRHTLQAYISELRKLLDDPIEWTGSAYRLVVDPDQIDSSRFERLLETGRRLLESDPGQAALTLKEALDLWTGRPYEDLAYASGMRIEISRLEELRLLALEGRLDADLRLGRQVEIIAEVESLSTEYPLREAFRAQQLLALYRLGRQAEALRAFDRLRRTLAEELGIDPSPALQVLEQRILDQDPSLNLEPNLEPDRSNDRSPTTIRGYELRDRIGEGAFGAVYRAFQTSVGREVAIKIFRPEFSNRPGFVKRFEAEAQFIADLEHPHIVALYDYWRDPNGAYQVMPHMRGGSLAHALERGPWNIGPALRLLDQVGAGLSYAHRKGIIHRDLKPSNVLLDEDGNAYLSDFGISAHLTNAAAALTYVPPEELRGDQVTRQSDIHSFAVLAFELFTGRSPTGRGDLPSISAIRPDLPAELANALLAATDAEPSRRPDRVEDFLRAVRQAIGADVVGAVIEKTESPSTTPLRNPYKGLRSFQETDASDFHGREGLLDELLEAVRHHRLVAVVGPSGGGKSSVVRAALLPALRAGALEESRSWLITDMFPGSYPFEELEAAILRVAVDDPGALVDELRSDDRGLMRIIKRILPTDDSQLVLVIDQFEEMFSMVDDEETRSLFLKALTTLVGDERGRVRVIITLRADFFDRPLQYATFGQLVKDGLVPVIPPIDEGLRLAISRPAQGVGLDLEPGLVGEIVNDVRGQPGGLPLLQYALTELVQRRQGSVLTMEGYRQTGGVLGALGRRAEEIFSGLAPVAQEAAHQLFLRLVTVDEGTDDTRRRVRQSELRSLDVDQAALETVIQQYASYRLLTFDRDPLTRSPTVEVAHEALLRGWDRLSGWIEEQRDELVLQRRLAAAHHEWEQADEGAAFLLGGGRLEHFESWAKDSGMSLTGAEKQYLASSRAEEDRRSRRRNVRRWSIVGVLAVATVIIGFLALSATNQARLATVRELAASAINALDEDPELSTLLAIESIRAAPPGAEPPLHLVSALHDAVRSMRTLLSRQWDASLPIGELDGVISPDGTLIAVTGGRETLQTWDASTGETAWEIKDDLGAGWFSRPHFSPDGSVLAVAFSRYWTTERKVEGGLATGIYLIEPRSGNILDVIPPSPQCDWVGLPFREPFTLDGVQLLRIVDPTPCFDGQLDLEFVDLESLRVTRRVPVTFPQGENDTRLFLVGMAGDGRLMVSDGASTQNLFAESTRMIDLGSDLLWEQPSVNGFVSRDGSTMALTGRDPAARAVHLVDPATGGMVRELTGHKAGVADIAFSPDGQLAYTAGLDGTARVWDTSTGSNLITLRGHEDGILRLSLDDTGTRLATFGLDGTARVSDLTTQPLGETMALDLSPKQINLNALDAAGGVAAVRVFDETVVFNPDTGEIISRFDDHTNQFFALTPDGGAIVYQRWERYGPNVPDSEWVVGPVVVRDVRTGAIRSELEGLCSYQVPEDCPALPPDLPYAEWVSRISVTPDGRRVAAGGDSHAVSVWDLDTRIDRFYARSLWARRHRLPQRRSNPPRRNQGRGAHLLCTKPT